MATSKKPAAKKALPATRQKTGRGGKRSTSFKPGQSGNPAGRPKKTEEERTLEAMCRERTPEALATILTLMADGQQERARLAAAQYVLDRAWGKPRESVELSGPDGGPIQSQNVHELSTEALLAIASGKAA